MNQYFLGVLVIIHSAKSLDPQNSPTERQTLYPRLQRVYHNETKNTSHPEGNRMYLYPTDLQSHALNASIDLLSSQKKHLENVTEQFKIMDERSNIYELKRLNAVLFSIEVVIKSELKILKKKLNNVEQLSSDEKVEPIKEVSIVCLLSSWTEILNLIGRMKAGDKTKGVEKAIEDMKRIVDLASVELRLYERIQEERLEKEENAKQSQEKNNLS